MSDGPEVPRFGVFDFRLVPREETEAVGLPAHTIEIELTYRWWHDQAAVRYQERVMRMLVTEEVWVRLSQAVGRERDL